MDHMPHLHSPCSQVKGQIDKSSLLSHHSSACIPEKDQVHTFLKRITDGVHVCVLSMVDRMFDRKDGNCDDDSQ